MNSSQPHEFRSGQDVVRFLLAQHRRIAHLFQQIAEDPGGDLVQPVLALGRLMAVHEQLEAKVIHPLAALVLPDGRHWVQARLAEEVAAGQTLRFDFTPGMAPEVRGVLNDLRADVLRHIEIEEEEEYPTAASLLDCVHLRQASLAARFADPRAAAR